MANVNSPKYIDRSDAGMEKHGSVKDGTHAAHIVSWEVANAALSHSPGAPMGDESRAVFTSDMNSSENLRIKSDTGNLITDRNNDAVVMDAIVWGDPISTKTAADRGIQQYEAALTFDNPTIADRLGDLTVLNADTGRTHLLRNHRDHQ